MTGPRANADANVVASKMGRVKSGSARSVNQFVDLLRGQRPGSSIPYVDPDCGGSTARILLLFQDPGPRAALPSGSGLLSVCNDDPSAETMWHLMDEAGLSWTDAIPWNAVLWYTGGGNKGEDRSAGLDALVGLIGLLPRLEVVVTFGGVAAKSWDRAIKSHADLARFQHIATLHPSIRGQARGRQQKMAVGRAQILDDLGRTKSLVS